MLEQLKIMISECLLEMSTIDDKIHAINELRKIIHELSPFKNEPVDYVKWVKSDNVVANDYNPNKVAPPEMQLLEVSIIEDGYTQPIVTFPNESKIVVVDGFHRNRVGKESQTVKSRIYGYLPIVEIRKENSSKDARMASTIRHNRARGKHQVSTMSEIVLELKNRNWENQRIAKQLGMDEDEILRLCQVSGLESLFTDRDFSKAWVADEKDVYDFQEVNDELNEEDFDLIKIPNESDSNRIFHTHDKWELVEYGFFSNKHKSMSDHDCEMKYIEFFSNENLFEETINMLFKECKNSCEHNLTNRSLNRIAWIGQACMAYKYQVPSVYCYAFNMLSEEKKQAANNVAFNALNSWLKQNGREAVDFDEAIQHERQVELY